jgi:uncharacterized protein with WD repeat
MMINNLLQINLRGYSVHVARDDETGDIILFKYDDSACDFGVFSDYMEASDWVHEPLSNITWCVRVEGDDHE